MSCTHDRLVYHDWPCSQPQTAYYSGLGKERSPQQEDNHTFTSQPRAAPSQQASQAVRTHSTAEQRANLHGSNQADGFQGCIPTSKQTRETYMPPGRQEGAVVSRAGLQDGSAVALKQKHGSQRSARATTTQLRADSGALEVHQTFSQSCSTQAETVSSTQRANACEPRKVWPASKRANPPENKRRKAGESANYTAAIHASRRHCAIRQLPVRLSTSSLA